VMGVGLSLSRTVIVQAPVRGSQQEVYRDCEDRHPRRKKESADGERQ
jgi:hypothetical protein